MVTEVNTSTLNTAGDVYSENNTYKILSDSTTVLIFIR
jgi:hypothetical protein